MESLPRKLFIIETENGEARKPQASQIMEKRESIKMAKNRIFLWTNSRGMKEKKCIRPPLDGLVP
jgi:hypothetical protein